MARTLGFCVLTLLVASSGLHAQSGAGCESRWFNRIGQPGAGEVGQPLSARVSDLGLGTSYYLGGRFAYMGGIYVNRVARWDGARWWDVGGGIEANIEGVEVWRYNSRPALFVGGDFNPEGDRFSEDIACWDGERWHALGAGTDNDVTVLTALRVYDDGTGESLYAGGLFRTMDGIVCNNIARWDGTRWHSLGTGVNDGVLSLAVYDDDGSGPRKPGLYAGGWFTVAGSRGVGRVARWDGVRWSEVGGGLDTAAQVLHVFDDDEPGPNRAMLYAGGSFESADGQAAKGIARWDGSRWLACGQGVWLTMSQNAGQVSALATFDDDGDGPRLPVLYAGGTFVAAGGIPVENAARWDGRGWSPIPDGGLDKTPFTFLAAGPSRIGPALYAGGNFDHAGSLPAGRVAQFSCPGVPCPADVNSDGVLDSDDFFDFLNAYFGNERSADFNGDGVVDSDDFFDFLNAYHAGC